MVRVIGCCLVGYWWVNQGRTFADELGEGFLWCSMVDRGGRTPWHWRTITSVRVNDLVVHYARGQVHAVSSVRHPMREAPRPVDPPKDPRQQPGWLVDVRVTPLVEPIALVEIPLSMRQHQAQRMFTQAGTVRQIYLAPIGNTWFSEFVRIFAARLPAEVVNETT